MILNDGYVFARDASPGDQAAFVGTPSRELFRAGTRLYRLVTPSLNEILMARWWFPKESWDRLLVLVRKTGCTVQEAVRSRLAVTREWNPQMSQLCIVRLEVDAYGWIGKTKHQPATGSDRDVLLLGGFDQAFVPNLGSSGSPGSAANVRFVFHGPIDL